MDYVLNRDHKIVVTMTQQEFNENVIMPRSLVERIIHELQPSLLKDEVSGMFDTLKAMSETINKYVGV